MWMSIRHILFPTRTTIEQVLIYPVDKSDTRYQYGIDNHRILDNIGMLSISYLIGFDDE